MIESLLHSLPKLGVYFFAGCALVGALLMIVLREPMRVALALISTMTSLGVIYGLVGVHFIAAFQILIYVGAVMVFMVYVIMLLDARDAGHGRRYSSLLWPGAVGAALFFGTVGYALWRGLPENAEGRASAAYGMEEFASAFLGEYWLHFELTSVLLLAAVVAALAVLKVARRARD